MKNSASGPKKTRVADAGRLHVGFGLLGDGARIALVELAGRGLEHVAEDRHRGLGEERVDVGGGRVGHQRHVGGFDALPAGDRGAVEGVAVGEHGFVDARAVGRDVLHLALGVGEAQVNELHFLVLDHLQDVAYGLRSVCHCHSPVLTRLNIGDAMPLPAAVVPARPAGAACRRLSDRVGAGLAGADADRFLDRRDEDLAVADAAGLGGLLDGLDGLVAACRRPSTTSIFTFGRKSTTYSAPR